MNDDPQRLRVCHLITDLDVGGAEMMLARLVVRFDRHDIDNKVIALGHGGPVADRIAGAGIPIVCLDAQAGRPNLSALWRLTRLLREYRPHILQTWLYHADLAGLLAGTAAGLPRILWNIRCAELDPHDHPRSLQVVLRLLAMASKRPAAIICNSSAGREAHIKLGYAAQGWTIIPNGFDTEQFRPQGDAREALRLSLGISARTPIVGILARFHPMKDHPNFLKAAAIVAERHPDVHFVAVGRGVDAAASLQTLIHDLGLTGRAHLLPERSDAARFLAGLDVAVSAAYSESFPNVVAEAMACGVPCVATNVGDSASIVGNADLIVPPKDPHALAGAILRVLNLDDAARAALGRSARQRIVDNFSLDGVAKQYADLYAKLASCAA